LVVMLAATRAKRAPERGSNPLQISCAERRDTVTRTVPDVSYPITAVRLDPHGSGLSSQMIATEDMVAGGGGSQRSPRTPASDLGANPQDWQ
jgi:hypothetical protein